MAAAGKLVSTVAKSEARVSPYLEKARARLDDLSPYRTGTEGRDRVLAGKPVFSDPVFWKALPSTPQHIDGVLKAWYPALAQDDGVLRSVREELGSAYVPLLLDPGIACRVDEFLPFAADWLKANEGGSPFQLREAFARSLGNGRVYRAISVHQDDVSDFAAWTPETRVDAVRDRGLRQPPSLRRDVPQPVAMLDALFEGVMRPKADVHYPGVARLMDEHIASGGGSSEKSLLTSYTYYPEIGLSIAGPKGEEWQAPVLMRAEIPEISLIKSTGLLSGHGLAKDWGRIILGKKPVGSPRVEFGGVFDRKNDPKIEVFTFLQKSGVTESVHVRGQRGPAARLLDFDWFYTEGS